MAVGIGLLVIGAVLVRAGFLNMTIADVLTGKNTPAPGELDTPAGGDFNTVSGPPTPQTGTDALLELFWNGVRPANVKNGVRQRQWFVLGHTDHVHTAAHEPMLGGLAVIARDTFHLRVSEYKPWGTVHLVHAPGSNHYSGQAFDASGAVADMSAYANYVMERYTSS